MSGFANNPPISPPRSDVDRDAHPAEIEFWGVLRPIHLKKKSAEWPFPGIALTTVRAGAL
jgi:hypothetical protein